MPADMLASHQTKPRQSIEDTQLGVPHGEPRQRCPHVIAAAVRGTQDQCCHHPQRGQVAGQILNSMAPYAGDRSGECSGFPPAVGLNKNSGLI